MDADAGRRVSFEEDSYTPFGYGSLNMTLLNSEYCAPNTSCTETATHGSCTSTSTDQDRDEAEAVTTTCNSTCTGTQTPPFIREKRVVSNEIMLFGLTSKADLKKKSRSLPSLTRSGDLKSLLDQTSYQTSISEHTSLSLSSSPATVSEECLSSSSSSGHGHGSDHDHDEQMTMMYSHGNEHHHGQSPQNDSCTQPAESLLPAHSACTGWGQFVDFVPLEHINSPQGKQICPIRRRKRASSFSTSSRYRQYSKNRLHTKQHGLSMYNNKKSSISKKSSKNVVVSTTTNEIADAFRIQLSFARK